MDNPNISTEIQDAISNKRSVTRRELLRNAGALIVGSGIGAVIGRGTTRRIGANQGNNNSSTSNERIAVASILSELGVEVDIQPRVMTAEELLGPGYTSKALHQDEPWKSEDEATYQVFSKGHGWDEKIPSKQGREFHTSEDNELWNSQVSMQVNLLTSQDGTKRYLKFDADKAVNDEDFSPNSVGFEIAYTFESIGPAQTTTTSVRTSLNQIFGADVQGVLDNGFFVPINGTKGVPALNVILATEIDTQFSMPDARLVLIDRDTESLDGLKTIEFTASTAKGKG